jgi:hypothetical protein
MIAEHPSTRIYQLEVGENDSAANSWPQNDWACEHSGILPLST